MSLVEIGRQFDDTTLAALRSCIGHDLRSYSGYCLLDEAEHVYKTARLTFDGFELDLVNEHEEMAIGPEFNEEQVAILHVQPAKGEVWVPPGKALTHVTCDFAISDVLVVIDEALLAKGSRRLIDFKCVQAVLFEDADGNLIAFDRDIWSDEYLSVRRGQSVSSTTHDFRPDWLAEPPYGYTYSRTIQRLSNQKLY